MSPVLSRLNPFSLLIEVKVVSKVLGYVLLTLQLSISSFAGILCLR